MTSEQEVPDTLTSAQFKTLQILPFFPATLSVLGSSYIVYRVKRRKTRGTKHRILLALSLNDISLSFWVAMGGALVPSTGRTFCEIQGFFGILATATSYYSASLSLYYLLTIRYGISETVVAKRYEPFAHVCSMLYPLVGATVCLVLDNYNQILTGCGIAAYPYGCDATDAYECTRGANAKTYFWIFQGAPIMVVFVIIAVAQALIYQAVRRRLFANRRYDFAASSRQNENDMLNSVVAQSMSYVAAYFISFLVPSVVSWIELFGYQGFADPSFFPLFCVVLLCYPIQGFLNFLCFIRPSYVTKRKELGDRSRWFALWQAVRSVDVTVSSTRKTLHSRSTSRAVVESESRKENDNEIVVSSSGNQDSWVENS